MTKKNAAMKLKLIPPPMRQSTCAPVESPQLEMRIGNETVRILLEEQELPPMLVRMLPPVPRAHASVEAYVQFARFASVMLPELQQKRLVTKRKSRS